MKIDHAAAIIAARTWANQMLAWEDCTMVHRFMVLQLLRASEAEIFATEQYDNLIALLGEWRQVKADRPQSRDSYAWMIEQLENCLGISKQPTHTEEN